MYRLYKSVSYHATSEELWQDIQEEGVLWGALPSVVQQYGKQAAHRFTYLARKVKDAVSMGRGNVLLEVDIDPGPPKWKGEDRWQFCVFDPIPLSKVRRISPPHPIRQQKDVTEEEKGRQTKQYLKCLSCQRAQGNKNYDGFCHDEEGKSWALKGWGGEEQCPCWRNGQADCKFGG